MVTNGPVATAGSIFIRLSVSGMNIPINAAQMTVAIVARAIASPIFGSNRTKAYPPKISPKDRPSNVPTLSSRQSILIVEKTKDLSKARFRTAMVAACAPGPCSSNVSQNLSKTLKD